MADVDLAVWLIAGAAVELGDMMNAVSVVEWADWLVDGMVVQTDWTKGIKWVAPMGLSKASIKMGLSQGWLERWPRGWRY